MNKEDHKKKLVSDKPKYLILSYLFLIVFCLLMGSKKISDWVSSTPVENSFVQSTLITAANANKFVSENLGIAYITTILENSVNEVKDLKPLKFRNSVDVLQYIGVQEEQTKKILMIGASSIQLELGGQLERNLKKIEGVEVLRFGQKSTGLNWPERLDWPAKTKELLAKFKPDILIFQFGGNDCVRTRNLYGPEKYAKFKTDLWREIYIEKIGNLISMFREAGGRHVIILGMPTMKSPKFAKKIKYMNETTEIAARVHGAYFLPLWEISADKNLDYREYFKYEGKTRAIRHPDGIHFTRYGARYVSAIIVESLRKYLDL
ncbi:MAG: DUF459 domain-containing protein [Leptospirales bacterium]